MLISANQSHRSKKTTIKEESKINLYIYIGRHTWSLRILGSLRGWRREEKQTENTKTAQHPNRARNRVMDFTGGKNPFVWITKPMQNFPHLLSM